jgi:hypothetical protein
MKKTLIFIITTILGIASVYAQDVSDKIKPRWMKHTPQSKSYGICYVPVTVYSNDIHSASTLALNELTKYLPRNWDVSTESEVKRESHTERQWDNITANKRTQSHTLNVISKGEPVSIRCKEVDHYWEEVSVGGNQQVKHTTLYQVTAPNSSANFENTYTTTKYGIHGFWRSLIIPGWGQFHKGSNIKGSVFLGGTAVLAGGIVYCHSRVNNSRKLAAQTHNADHIRIYQRRISNFSMARNVCIGSVAALYLWNLVDAIVAPGARRVVVKPTTDFGGYIMGGSHIQNDAVGMSASLTF